MIYDIRRKLVALQGYCEVLGRSYDTVLRTHMTGWLILAENEARVQSKLKHYFPEGLEQRYSGPRRDFVVAGTPEDAVSYYRMLANAGIQYFVVETLDAADEETIRLLAEHVVPQVRLSQ